MVSVPNSLSMNAIKFQKAKAAPQAIAKNIKAPTEKAKPISIPELWPVTDKEIAFLRQAKAQGMDQQWALDFIKQKRQPTGIKKVVQVWKDVAGGLAWWLPNLWPTIVWGALQSIGSMWIAPWMNLQTQATKAIQSAWKELSDRGIQMRDITEKAIWARPEATGTQIWRMWVPLLASAVASAPLWLTSAGAWALQTVKAGLASRSIPTVLKGIAGASAVWWAETAMIDVAGKWRIDPTNVAIWWAIWGGIAGLPVLKKLVSDVWWWVYNLAFKQAQQKYLNQAASNFWKNAWELVAKEWLDAWSLKWASKEIKNKLSTTREALQSQAAKAGNIDAWVLNTTLKTDLKSKMLKWIQEWTEFYKATSDNIDDLVDFYISKEWTLQGNKVIDLVKELNTQLPAWAFKKSELALSKAKTSTLIKWFKNWLQKYLDDEVGDIVKLYWDYSRQKLISDILNDVQVKKMLWRSLLWATVWWVWAGWSDIANGNIWSWLKKAVIWALFWWLITRTSTDPAFLYKVWRVLR